MADLDSQLRDLEHRLDEASLSISRLRRLVILSRRTCLWVSLTAALSSLATLISVWVVHVF